MRMKEKKEQAKGGLSREKEQGEKRKNCKDTAFLRIMQS